MSVLSQYDKFVKPSFDNYISPTKAFADLIIPRGHTNTVALHIIVEHLKLNLKDRGLSSGMQTPEEWGEIPTNVVVLPPNNERKYIHTIIRDINTTRDDLIYHSERLFRLLVEEALNLLPYESVTVVTSTGAEFKGLQLTSKICGISIMRGGSSMTDAFHKVVKNGIQGTVLIQSDQKKNTYVIFLQVSTRSIRLLYLFA